MHIITYYISAKQAINMLSNHSTSAEEEHIWKSSRCKVSLNKHMHQIIKIDTDI